VLQRKADAIPVQTRISIAFLLFCCGSLVAQNPEPTQATALQESAPKSVPSRPRPAPAPGYTDPCAAHATTVDFDTCYADQFKLFDQDLNHLYRNTLLAFEGDIADANKRGDQGQLKYDATAIADLKASQTAWTKYRDLHCTAAGQQLQGGSIQPIVVNKCMILVTRHRIDDIRAAYEIGGRNLQ
jgi:uncharacterized protein YecT (DUF1311 family)